MKACSKTVSRMLAYFVLNLAAVAPSTSQQWTQRYDNTDSLIAAADSHLAKGETEEAQRLLVRALDMSPNSPSANLVLGNLLLSQHRYAEAMDRFETVLAIDAHNAEARKGELDAATSLALQAKTAGNQEAAFACLMHARESLPKDPTLLTDLGIQARAMHLLGQADEVLTTALALDPKNLKVLYALARVEVDEEHFAAAERHFRDYLVVRPNDASAHYGLGHLFQMQQRTDEAIQEFQKSIVLQPVQTESYYQLGQINLDAHRDREARSWFEKTLARSPNHGGALTGMGILDYRAKDYASARAYLRAATQASTDYQLAHYYLGLALTRLGDKPAADSELRLASDLARKQQGRGEAVPAGTFP